MAQTGLLPALVAQAFQHGVDRTRNAGTALDCETGRLVEDQHLLVLVQHHVAQNVCVMPVPDRIGGHVTWLAGRFSIQRRDAHHLPGLQPRSRLDPSAIHPHLSGAQQFLQLAEADAWKMHLEPAVEAHARLIRIHGYL